MLYYENTLCITGTELIRTDRNPAGLIPEGTYKSLYQRGHVKVVRRACYGQPALIEFNSLPTRYKELVVAKFGDPDEQAISKPFREKITPDSKALTFYSNYLLADGRSLPAEIQREYCINACVLNAVDEILIAASNVRKALSAGKVKGFWESALVGVNNVREELGHTLPSHAYRLRLKYQEYKEHGYSALISGKFCNDNSRKVSVDIERLLMSLYTMPEKPFAATVHEMYADFMNGKIKVVDRNTGEVFDPKAFKKAGHPIHLSESTVKNYLNNPKNRAIVDKKRNGQFEYNSMHRPHHHRNPPNFAFSKISMDDRDLPRKLVDGKRVKAYYSYDVSSGCVIGKAYSRKKDEALFIDCMRDMFRFIDRNKFGMPMEVEVENHLVNKFFDDLANLFPFVRICRPGNSQEKHAEQLNRAKKYGIEKKTQTGIGRWWAKSEAYRVDNTKVNDEFAEKSYTFERLVADDLAAVEKFNHSLHPNQKRYPGKTRWQVLCENLNPDCPEVPTSLLYRTIGERTSTTIRRNQYVTVQHAKYQLPNPSLIARLQPGNYSVEAYFLPNTEGIITDVYLYQNGVYLCKCDKITNYNTAKAEWEESDSNAYQEQSKYVASFDGMAKKGTRELYSPFIITEEESEIIKTASPVEVKIKSSPKADSIDEILADYNPETIRNYARQSA